MTVVGCPDDAFLYELVHGQLAEDALAEADAHLDACADCRDVVIELARAVGGVAGDGALRRGSLVGRYVVLGVVGRGAMGVVYAGFDPELERKVALKLVLPDATGDEPSRARDRVVREAQAMARLSHPNVVGVYEVGAVGDRVYVAMELVDGVSLREWLAADRRPWREVRDVFAQAGRGLAAAHAAGLVHRDFKPDNVIVGGDGRARVTDFGLARVDGEIGDRDGGQGAAALTLTRTGAVVGTPAYMAPEQFARGSVDARSDQFSFCVALYEALYGDRPFRADSFEELEQRVVAAVVPEPPRGAAPRRLFRAIARGLRSSPAERWPSMEELVGAIERDPGGRLARAVAVAGIAAAVAVAVVATRGPDERADAELCAGGAALAAETWSEARATGVRAVFADVAPYGAATATGVVRALDRWRDEWVDMHGATCRATRVVGAQSEQLMDVRMQCLRRRLHELDSLAELLEAGDRDTVANAGAAVAALTPVTVCGDVDSLTGIEPPSSASADAVAALERDIDAAKPLITTARLAAAGERAQALVTRARELGYRPALAEALLLLADARRGTGDLDAADELAYEALWAAEAARADRIAARAWVALAGIAGQRGRYDAAAHLSRHAAAAVERAGSPPDLEALALANAGIADTNLGAHAAAADALERALALRVELYGDRALEVARSHTALGNLDRARRDYDGALDHHRAALAIDAAVLGERHPAVGRDRHNVAGVLRLQGDLDGALAQYARALAIKRDALGGEHIDVGVTENSIGLIRYDRGEDDDARAHFERALAIFEAAGHPDRAASLHNLALVAARGGKHRAALVMLERARARYVETYGEHHERLARVWLAIGRSQLALRQRAGAREAYRRGGEIAAAIEGGEALVSEAERGVASVATPSSLPVDATAAPPQPRRRAPAGSTVYAPTQGWE